MSSYEIPHCKVVEQYEAVKDPNGTVYFLSDNILKMLFDGTEQYGECGSVIFSVQNPEHHYGLVECYVAVPLKGDVTDTARCTASIAEKYDWEDVTLIFHN